jgi:hypothetical protein
MSPIKKGVRKIGLCRRARTYLDLIIVNNAQSNHLLRILNSNGEILEIEARFSLRYEEQEVYRFYHSSFGTIELRKFTFPDGKCLVEAVQKIFDDGNIYIFTALQTLEGKWIEYTKWKPVEMEIVVITNQRS